MARRTELENNPELPPIMIQFGTEFVASVRFSEKQEPLMVVFDVGEGEFFYASPIERNTLKGVDGREITEEIIKIGGTHIRNNIARLTGRTLSLEEILDGHRKAFSPSMREGTWTNIVENLTANSQKGPREITQ